MKLNIYIFVFLILLSLTSAMPVSDVKLTSYVNDYTNTIKSGDRDTINELASSLKNAGAAEVAVVIVDSLDGMSKEEYAIQIAHENLGDTQKDNGLLILVAMQEREYRIEVGYGLEGILNDAKVGRIARETIVPNFKEGDYGWGLIQFIATIHLELLPDQANTIPENYVDTGKDTDLVSSIFFGIFAIIIILTSNIMPLIIFFLIIRAIIMATRKDKGKKRNDDDSLTAAILASSFFKGGRGGGGFGGGSFGGGGFGGGGFGGGGAGGSW